MRMRFNSGSVSTVSVFQYVGIVVIFALVPCVMVEDAVVGVTIVYAVAFPPRRISQPLSSSAQSDCPGFADVRHRRPGCIVCADRLSRQQSSHPFPMTV